MLGYESVPQWQVWIGDMVRAVEANGLLVMVAITAVVLGVMFIRDLRRKAKAQRDIEDAYGLPRPPHS